MKKQLIAVLGSMGATLLVHVPLANAQDEQASKYLSMASNHLVAASQAALEAANLLQSGRTVVAQASIARACGEAAQAKVYVFQAQIAATQPPEGKFHFDSPEFSDFISKIRQLEASLNCPQRS